MERKKFGYGTLFFTMFTLSAFTFGGGFVIISMMQKKIAGEYGWLSEEEILNLTAISQAAPGPMAVNMSMLVGYRMGGPLGLLVSVIGTVLPPLIILSIVSLFYDAFSHSPVVKAALKMMQAGVAAVLCDVVLGLSGKVLKGKSLFTILLLAGAFAAAYVLGVNIVFIILGAGLLGALKTLWPTLVKGGKGA